MQIIFWLSVGAVIYTYIGYPVLLYLLGWIRPRLVNRAHVEPEISIIIAAHNEEDGIGKKLENTLNLSYPSDRREIIVVSDGSTDRTVKIAERYEEFGVKCIALERSGKSVALNEGVRLSQGEVLVFTDVGAIAEDDCLEELMADFADLGIGCVSTEDHVLENYGGASEGAYVKYEMLLRQLESRTGSCVAVSGSFYAIKRELCPKFPPEVATDLLSVFEVVKRGYRAVTEPRAVARMGAVETHVDEFQRKARTVLMGMSCLPAMMPLLNPFRYGLFALELFSHKFLRWAGPLFLVSAFTANAFLIDRPVYTVTFGAQITCYVLAVVGIVSEKLAKRSAVIRLPAFYLSTNLSALVAFWKYLKGERVAVWQPSKRKTERMAT